MTQQSGPGWKPWGDFPAVVIISVIAGLIAIFVFVTGKTNLPEFINGAENIIQSNYGLPDGAKIIETLPIATDTHGNRMLILWMVNPVDVPQASGAIHSCTDETRGSHYSGPTRVSLYDLQTKEIINTINVVDSLGFGEDSFDIPYNVRPEYYSILGQKGEDGQGKPSIMLLKDYNGDGKSYEFALFNKSSCKSVDTTLIGYSEKQDKVINYPINLMVNADGQQKPVSAHWGLYLFTYEHMQTPGYWNYQIDYRPTGGSLFQYDIHYDKDKEDFEGTLVATK